MPKPLELPFSSRKQRQKELPRYVKEIATKVTYLLQTGEPLVYEVLREEVRFLQHCMRLQSWYGAERVELRTYRILLDGKPVVKCRIPQIYASYGLQIPSG
jgi:hypothetical protein